jgi:predicted ATPase/DNA-binding CsgD family transcriptional regulator
MSTMLHAEPPAVPPSAFVGRAAELSMLGDLIRRPEIRLLTLVGVGGAGKTRMALEAVRRFGPDTNQAAFVDLAPLPSADLVATTIADALGLDKDVPPEELARLLRDQPRLLILDNFEHVLAAASLVSFLLGACPRLRVLVTSRSVLGIRGEHVYRVRPMLSDECVQLFVDRARAADHGFILDTNDRPVVTEISRRVDGLPLAIELAAARVRILPPKALLQRLEPRLAVLAGGERDRPLRHQALRNTIEWSYRLLPDTEQALFRHVAVFRGSWTLEAAATVAALQDVEVLDGISSLVDNSLVESVPTATGEPRFRVLETIREYALEQLAGRGERTGAEGRLIRHLIANCESDISELHGVEQAGWFAGLELDLDNVRAALAWTSESGRDVDLALQLAALLHNFWELGGHWHEGQMWLERSLAAAQEVDPVVLARALTIAGDMAYLLEDYTRARQHLERAVELWRQERPSAWLASSLRLLARVAVRDGQLSHAQLYCHEALDAATRSDAGAEIALAHNVVAIVAQNLGDLSEAMTHYEEGLRVARELVHLPAIALILWGMGTLAERQGDLDRAAAVFTEGLAISQQVSDKKEAARCLLGLARVGLQRNTELESAERMATESAELLRRMGAKRDLEQAETVLVTIQERRVSASRARPRRSDGLTAREAEIVGLIGEGTSNAEISTRLVLSVRTVERHIENIYSKLGVQGRTARAAVAGYAVRNGITTPHAGAAAEDQRDA